MNFAYYKMFAECVIEICVGMWSLLPGMSSEKVLILAWNFIDKVMCSTQFGAGKLYILWAQLLYLILFSCNVMFQYNVKVTISF